jgi:hypothetical protein
VQGYASRKRLTYYATFLIFLKTFSFLREIPLPWAFFVKLETLFRYDYSSIRRTEIMITLEQIQKTEQFAKWDAPH